MKQVAGHTDLAQIGKAIPDLKEKGLSPYQALLHAIWTDERFASCCVSMRNTDQVRENAEAARNFKPLTQAQIEQFATRASRPHRRSAPTAMASAASRPAPRPSWAI